ncbi:GNAT family N-acetyltransferase [Veronia pacifica]|nr:GNAT family N-acetyltransferase [Veronia pacifica]
MSVEILLPNKHAELIQLWEHTVRHCYPFYCEHDISTIKQSVLPDLLDMLTLRAIFSPQQVMIGFVGVRQSKVELLFVNPSYQRQGYGKTLLRYATEILRCDWLEVDSRNKNARMFYEKMGFVDSMLVEDSEPTLIRMRR